MDSLNFFLTWAIFSAAAVSVAEPDSGALHCKTQGSEYSVLDGDTLLFNGQRVAVYLDSQWFAAPSKSGENLANLELQKTTQIDGSDKLGSWNGTQMTWSAGKTPFVTSVKNYARGNLVVFSYSFPEGATGMASNHSGVSTNFPALSLDPAQVWSGAAKVLSWQGSFVTAHRDRTFGSASGPYVFYDSHDVSAGRVVVASPLDHFMVTSQAESLFDGKSATWVPGVSGTVESVPAGFQQSFLLFQGQGVTQTIYDWGLLLQKLYETTRLYDVTLDKIGYQTDNGAMYCFCPRDCDNVLLNVKKYLDGIGVPLGYLSFQGDWWHGSGGAPWCVSEWITNNRYPMPLADFHSKLGIPLQLYAPYFCNDTKYARDNGGNFTMVTSDTSLPGCKDFLFKDPAPEESRRFYDWLYAYGKAFGMVSYEPDFMNQNYNCMPTFTKDTTSAVTWMKGMNDAGMAANVSVQWCFATPSNLLEALTLPAVTNFRASFDYYYGGSYNIGLSSLLIWSLGGAPSKDTFWTTDNAPLGPESGGCDRKRGCPADHDNATCELHTILSVMSTGPVGFSDAIGKTNASLIMRTCSSDGTLLKPIKAITSIDATLSATNPPPGDVYMTFDGESPSSPQAYYVLSFNMRTSWYLTEENYWPPLPKEAKTFVYRERWNWPLCKDGDTISSCVRLVKRLAGHPLSIELPARDSQNTTLTPRLTTVWPVCSNGWALLGELAKYSSLSRQRFRTIQCTDLGLSFVVIGSSQEKVSVTALDTDSLTSSENKYAVHVVDVIVPTAGYINVTLP